jgi:hypothetical protein
MGHPVNFIKIGFVVNVQRPHKIIYTSVKIYRPSFDIFLFFARNQECLFSATRLDVFYFVVVSLTK